MVLYLERLLFEKNDIYLVNYLLRIVNHLFKPTKLI